MFMVVEEVVERGLWGILRLRGRGFRTGYWLLCVVVVVVIDVVVVVVVVAFINHHHYENKIINTKSHHAFSPCT
jgi:uncharacterized membrane protein YhaH (DUF805 family)